MHRGDGAPGTPGLKGVCGSVCRHRGSSLYQLLGGRPTANGSHRRPLAPGAGLGDQTDEEKAPVHPWL